MTQLPLSAASDRLAPFPDEPSVLAHGSYFRPAWWEARVPHGWGTWLRDLPEPPKTGAPTWRGRGYAEITRRDMLAQAHATQTGDADRWGRTLAGCYAWGTGKAAFLVGRRARAFAETQPDELLDKLAGAAHLLTSDPVAAYASMLRGGPNHIAQLGPAFFTKFLYAADARLDTEGTPQPGRALILDRVVARALNQLTGTAYPSTGWTPRQYGDWLDYAHRLAHHNPEDPVRADAVEYRLFTYGQPPRRLTP